MARLRSTTWLILIGSVTWCEEANEAHLRPQVSRESALRRPVLESVGAASVELGGEHLLATHRGVSLTARRTHPCIADTHSWGVVLDVDFDARGLLSGRVLMYGPIKDMPLAARAAALSTLASFSRRDVRDCPDVELISSFSVS